jgi:hypothetical protein
MDNRQYCKSPVRFQRDCDFMRASSVGANSWGPVPRFAKPGRVFETGEDQELPVTRREREFPRRYLQMFICIVTCAVGRAAECVSLAVGRVLRTANGTEPRRGYRQDRRGPGEWERARGGESVKMSGHAGFFHFFPCDRALFSRGFRSRTAYHPDNHSGARIGERFWPGKQLPIAGAATAPTRKVLSPAARINWTVTCRP